MRTTLFLIVACVISLSGCVAVRSPLLEEKREALRLIDRGSALLREKKLEEAQAAFTLAYELAALPEAVDGLGCVAFGRGDEVTAARLFGQAFELDRSYVEALANLALLYDMQGKHEDARVVYGRVLEYDPMNIRARNNFSALLFDARQYGLARSELLKAQAVVKHPVLIENFKRVASEKEIH